MGMSFLPSEGLAARGCLPVLKGHNVLKDDAAVPKVGQWVPVNDIVPTGIGSLSG